MPDVGEKHIVISDGNIIHQFGLIFDFATIGIIVSDRKGKVLNFNSKAENQFGYQKDEILGENIKVLIPVQYHAYHARFKRKFYLNPVFEQMGVNRDLFGLRKDGADSIKLSGEKSIINVICSCSEDEIAIAVRDQGMGISEVGRKHLFERFFRSENASNIQGTGLGLYIVAIYPEVLHGHIEIQSTLNEGSCFTIFIPNLI